MKPLKKMMLIVYLGFALSGAGALLIWYGERQVSKEQARLDKVEADSAKIQLRREADERQVELKAQQAELKEQLAATKKELTESQKLIQEKSNIIERKSDEFREMVLATNRYPIVRVLTYGQGDSKTFDLSLQNPWPTFVENISVIVCDYDKLLPFLKLEETRGITSKDNFLSCVVFSTTTPLTLSSEDESSLNFEIKNECRYLIVTKCKGKTVYQRFTFIKVGYEMYFYYSISDIKDNFLVEGYDSRATWNTILTLRERALSMKAIISFN